MHQKKIIGAHIVYNNNTISFEIDYVENHNSKNTDNETGLVLYWKQNETDNTKYNLNAGYSSSPSVPLIIDSITYEATDTIALKSDIPAPVDLNNYALKSDIPAAFDLSNYYNKS